MSASSSPASWNVWTDLWTHEWSLRAFQHQRGSQPYLQGSPAWRPWLRQVWPRLFGTCRIGTLATIPRYPVTCRSSNFRWLRTSRLSCHSHSAKVQHLESTLWVLWVSSLRPIWTRLGWTQRSEVCDRHQVGCVPPSLRYPPCTRFPHRRNTRQMTRHLFCDRLRHACR